MIRVNFRLLLQKLHKQIHLVINGNPQNIKFYDFLPISSGWPFKYMALRKVNNRQRSDSGLTVLIFGVVAHYACNHPQNENKLIVYSNSPAVHL